MLRIPVAAPVSADARHVPTRHASRGRSGNTLIVMKIFCPMQNVPAFGSALSGSFGSKWQLIGSSAHRR
jgi:hypothetical protein